MIRLILKNLWSRRYRNGWLLAELIVVSVVMWHLMDPVVVLTHDRSLPTGITEDGLYQLTLATLSPSAARYEGKEDSTEARIAHVRRILSRVRDYKEVQSATLQFEGIGPFGMSQWMTNVRADTAGTAYSLMMMFFEPQTDFFRTFGFTEVEGQTNEELDRKLFGHKEVCLTTNPIPGEKSLGFQGIEYGSDSVSWTATATVGKVKYHNGMQPLNMVMYPTSLEKRASSIPENVQIVFRTRPGVSEKVFLHEFREWAYTNLRAGNLYMRGVKSYHDLIQENDANMDVDYKYQVNLIMVGFFLISLFLGVAGAFWLQTRSRKEEVGVMKSFGASSGNIVRLLLGEGWVLTTFATLIGCFLYFQYVYTEGLYTNMWNESERLPEYWVNHFATHFWVVSAIVWVILLIVVSVGIYIPARSLSKVSPVDALRDE